MSFTARERYNPPPRKKSCASCIKAKRRCDFAVPACLRCSQRQIQCEYPSRTPRTKAKSPSRVALEPAPLQDVAVPDGGLGDDCTEGAKPMACQFGPIANVDEESSQHNMHQFLADLATLNYSDESRDYDAVPRPSMLTAPATKGLHDRLTEIVARRLQFSLDQIQKAPRTMVMEMQTPWSHPLLYADSMPRSMQGTKASLCPVIGYIATNKI
ncbi:transcriptional regulator family: Fungal Specific TF [Trichoderma aggressivum f. europaeum]|uniref:Transcriptional regulator family: Fungal Specific TF n=1 Tax=Trichoderma aggressivum f. europaeum TaxID=173218 RepID=A0AAE1IYF1_9HYPO|nr:transcriptional regulator family: Fungal Specific TF [Trichoderma aggressivum f. europaeum]